MTAPGGDAAGRRRVYTRRPSLSWWRRRGRRQPGARAGRGSRPAEGGDFVIGESDGPDDASSRGPRRRRVRGPGGAGAAPDAAHVGGARGRLAAAASTDRPPPRRPRPCGRPAHRGPACRPGVDRAVNGPGVSSAPSATSRALSALLALCAPCAAAPHHRDASCYLLHAAARRVTGAMRNPTLRATPGQPARRLAAADSSPRLAALCVRRPVTRPRPQATPAFPAAFVPARPSSPGPRPAALLPARRTVPGARGGCRDPAPTPRAHALPGSPHRLP